VRILFLSPRQCWPAHSGAKLREYHFARALAQRAELTYVHFTDPGVPPLTCRDLPFCHEVVAVPKPLAYGPAQLLQGLVTRWPLPILNYTSDVMSSVVERLAARSSYDLIHLDSIHMIRYGHAVASPSAKLIYNWHNIESEAMQRYSKTVTSLPRRWYARETASKLAALEREILRSGFGHIVCSQREKDQLQGISGKARVAVVENGVDATYFAGASDSAEVPNRLVFVGTMDYYPNVEATTSFARNIWPLLRQRWPELELWIVGAKPTPAVTALQEVPGVTVTGTVADIRPFYQKALAAVVPLRTGGGTRLKILEAMAAGVPVISTELGAEGLAVSPGQNILIAGPDESESWVTHLEALTQSSTLRRELTDAALQLTRTRYDWNILGGILADTYEQWLQGA
jgi:sugar transferase (PEP-CTERM/EpsH1 system associated)